VDIPALPVALPVALPASPPVFPDGGPCEVHGGGLPVPAVQVPVPELTQDQVAAEQNRRYRAHLRRSTDAGAVVASSVEVAIAIGDYFVPYQYVNDPVPPVGMRFFQIGDFKPVRTRLYIRELGIDKEGKVKDKDVKAGGSTDDRFAYFIDDGVEYRKYECDIELNVTPIHECAYCNESRVFFSQAYVRACDECAAYGYNLCEDCVPEDWLLDEQRACYFC
jgi:hypothetical protein